MELVAEADVFQLFWSHNSRTSRYVELEWRHALSLSKADDFVRPMYWERPRPSAPPELDRLHFEYFGGYDGADEGLDEQMAASVSDERMASYRPPLPSPAGPVYESSEPDFEAKAPMASGPPVELLPPARSGGGSRASREWREYRLLAVLSMLAFLLTSVLLYVSSGSSSFFSWSAVGFVVSGWLGALLLLGLAAALLQHPFLLLVDRLPRQSRALGTVVVKALFGIATVAVTARLTMMFFGWWTAS